MSEPPLGQPEPISGVHPELARYHDELARKSGVHKVGARSHSVVGFGGNINFIDAPGGTVVVNTGTTIALSEQALNLYRQVSDKPIVALIYTHGYSDHTGGGPALVPKERRGKVEVFANSAWHGFIEQSGSPLQPEIALRAASQVGWLLEPGASGTIGNALTPPVRGAGGSGYITPTVDIAERTKLAIAGVELDLIPAPHDLDDGLIVWMPDERLLFGGDLLLLYDLYPPLATPRCEPRRDPQKWIDSMALAASLQPEHLINAYGPPISGTAEVRARLLGQQRVAQFMVDDVNRRLLRGENADDIAAGLVIPESVSLGRYYGEFYHRLSWIVRSLISREFGHFSGDVADLVRLPPQEEATQFAAELGGIDGLLDRAERAMKYGNPRWGLRLATLALQVERQSTRAIALRHHAMRTIAYSSDSANERNYLLTAVAMESGKLDRSSLLRLIRGNAPGDVALHRQPSHWLSVLGHKLHSRDSKRNPPFTVEFSVIDKGVTLAITVLPAVMLRGLIIEDVPADLRLELSLEALIRGIEGMAGFSELRATGAVRVAGTDALFGRFIGAFNW